ncbi:MAG: ATP-binding cassette domain-containing protein [Firmicutes bacterium]|nr:ATP-binding cassette domain-containing protein [Bacillota bacterium]
MEEKKVLLSVQDLVVKFRVRGRILTAIRGISLDIYENESIAIVGESGSGKSVFTKTFAGMLDDNGFIDNGKIIFNDPVLADTVVAYGPSEKQIVADIKKNLDESSNLISGAAVFRQMKELESENKRRGELSEEEVATIAAELADLRFERAETFNKRQTYNPRTEKDLIKQAGSRLKELDLRIKELEKEEEKRLKANKLAAKNDTEYNKEYEARMAELKARYQEAVSTPPTARDLERNEILAKEVWLSVGRFGARQRKKSIKALEDALKKAMELGEDLDDENTRNLVFDTVAFRVKYLDETEDKLHGNCILNLAKFKYSGDWTQIRGKRIATVFQDPMSSLNPILTIGSQITSIIIKHQNCSEAEARMRALELMDKVGIPDAENRFDDYPFQYSGGMRQRIVIAIALSCQPKILICDEPTTALDVTIQAQILQLIKDLQKDFGYTIVFITHDLGVVANIADRVGVLYAGQLIELGTVEDVFYDPRHPYTWALLSSMPQLAERNTTLYSITGTPPSLYNEITGDPFAPRNPYCLKIDRVKEAPMFKVSETHYAKTWLEDPRAPKVEKPEIIRDIHQKLIDAFNI